MSRADTWYDQFSSGALNVELNATSAVDMFTLVNVVSTVMREKRYLEPTARRVRVILQELITNVAAHVPDRHARVRVEMHERYLRRIAIDVGDDGDGIPDGVLDEYTTRFLDGEREHGLLVVSRLATAMYRVGLPEAAPSRSHVMCEVVEPEPERAVFARYARVGVLRIGNYSPPALWIGPDDSYVGYDSESQLSTAIDRLMTAIRRQWMPVVDRYLAPLRDAGVLVIEVVGYDFPSVRMRLGRDFAEHILDAVDLYFADHLARGRVVLWVDTLPDRIGGVLQWAGNRRVRQFRTYQENEAIDYVNRLIQLGDTWPTH